jgi:hypothetical protein
MSAVDAVGRAEAVMDALIAVGLGGATGLLAVLARRLPLLGWLMLVPLAAAVYLYSPLTAALAGAAAGGIAAIPGTAGLPSPVKIIAAGADVVGWAVVMAVAAWLWPDRTPAWGALVMPAAAAALAAWPRFAAPPGYGGGAHVTTTPSRPRSSGGCRSPMSRGSAAT